MHVQRGNIQALWKNLTAVRGRLTRQKSRSEKARDKMKGVVEWMRKSLLRKSTKMVNTLPTPPNKAQRMAAQAAISELASSMMAVMLTSFKGPKSD